MLAAGERGRVRVLPAAPEPLPGVGSAGRAACSPGWVSQPGVTAWFVRAHTEMSQQDPAWPSELLSISCTALISPCSESGLNILPSFLPSFDPCRAQPSLI